MNFAISVQEYLKIVMEICIEPINNWNKKKSWIFKNIKVKKPNPPPNNLV